MITNKFYEGENQSFELFKDTKRFLQMKYLRLFTPFFLSEAQSFNLYSKLFTSVSDVISCDVQNGKAVWFGRVNF